MGQYGSRCMQPEMTNIISRNSGPMSEDCLTLNVWAPKDAAKAAVMVWIHGGAFLDGSGSQAIYNGAALAGQGVVVVTVNYRLGFLGVFAYPNLNRESPTPAVNFGLMDQIAALQWVRKNIAAFGGDPDNVTIFGESAGGESVYALMVSPPARGLFHRAIAESGPILGRMHTLAQAGEIAVSLAKQWGASDPKTLRAVAVKEIVASARLDTVGQYQPVIDGTYMPDEPARLFAAGKQAPVPFLLGANSFEASLIALFHMKSENVLASARIDESRLHEWYGTDPDKIAQGFFMDSGFFMPVRFLAAQMSKVHQPAFLYYFSYVPERRRARSRGAMHAGELPFVFDNINGLLAPFMTDQDRQMAATVSAYWVSFAKSGNPNRHTLPAWPAYTPASDQLLELGTTITVRQHFRKEQLDLLEERSRSRLGMN